jgi:hypothetical protein
VGRLAVVAARPADDGAKFLSKCCRLHS